MATYIFQEIAPDGAEIGIFEEFIFPMASRPNEFERDGVRWRYDFMKSVRSQSPQAPGFEFDMLATGANCEADRQALMKAHPDLHWREDGAHIARSMSEVKTICKRFGIHDQKGVRPDYSNRKRMSERARMLQDAARQ